ncbi:MAG: DUF5017 domain-containing protein [Candidatus Cryptobacteroides sp.]|nr:DUF5017 domain-containing protein [Candidatus Cryptobacteroides sp.]
MKKIVMIGAVAALAAACTQNVVYEIDYTVSLDKENTYMAGEPVRFNFDGLVDNIVFYSGEIGHQYKFKDRYEVPMESVKAADMNIEYQARYGEAGALEVWVSNSFEGLNGSDGAADRAAIKAMVDGGMKGWTKLDYQEGASTKWTSQNYDLKDYMNGFSIAFHWNPPTNTKTQRTYWINGEITLDLEGMNPSVIDFTSLDLVSVMMNGEIEDPYYKNNGNGTINLNKREADIVMQGVGANALPYAIDGWLISKPIPLNKVSNDQGTVIKNLQNYLHTFEYTWTEPGTYTVTFVGTNSNYAGRSEKVHEFTIIVLPKLLEE